MKKRVKHIAVAQFGKMLAAIYFVISLPILAIVLLAISTGLDMPSLGVGVVVMMTVASCRYTQVSSAHLDTGGNRLHSMSYGRPL